MGGTEGELRREYQDQLASLRERRNKLLQETPPPAAPAAPEVTGEALPPGVKSIEGVGGPTFDITDLTRSAQREMEGIKNAFLYVPEGTEKVIVEFPEYVSRASAQETIAEVAYRVEGPPSSARPTPQVSPEKMKILNDVADKVAAGASRKEIQRAMKGQRIWQRTREGQVEVGLHGNNTPIVTRDVLAKPAEDKVTPPVTIGQIPEVLYHGTTQGALRKIVSEGLKPTAMGQVSLSDTEEYAKSYADRKGGPRGIVLRIKGASDIVPDTRISVKGDFRSTSSIPVNRIEIKMPDGTWVPLKDVDVSIGTPEIKSTVPPPSSTEPLIRSAGIQRKTITFYSELGHEYRDRPTLNSGRIATVGDLIDVPALFEKYPSLATVKMKWFDYNSRLGVGTPHTRGDIIYVPFNINVATQLNFIAHEMWHQIQHFEGLKEFAPPPKNVIGGFGSLDKEYYNHPSEVSARKFGDTLGSTLFASLKQQFSESGPWEPWMESLNEWRAATRLPSYLHRESVKKALSEGKPVPESVLADYPDLAQQGKPVPEP